MPHATAPGFQRDAIGMNRSRQPKAMKWSSVNAPMWMPQKTSASVPRKVWRSSSHAGRPRRRMSLVDRTSPHTMAKPQMSHVTRPAALETYHVILGSSTAITG